MKPTDAKGVSSINLAVKPTGNVSHDTFQRSTKDAVEKLAGVPLVQGNLLTVSVGTELTTIRHNLGRVWQGYMVVQSTITGITDDGDHNATTLKLKAPTAGTCKIWVF